MNRLRERPKRNNMNEESDQTFVNFNDIKNIVQRTYENGHDTCFFVAHKTLSIKKTKIPETTGSPYVDGTFLEVRELNGEKVLRFRMAWPGQDAYGYCAQRIIEKYAPKL